MSKERIRCMFDTVAFNRVVEYPIPVELIAESVEVYATHIQLDELIKTGDCEKKNKLIRVFNFLVQDDQKLPTESSVWEITKWNGGKWTKEDNLYRPIKAALDKCKLKKNNLNDALISETAITNDYILVTDDVCLNEEAPKFGARCMYFKQFLKLCGIKIKENKIR